MHFPCLDCIDIIPAKKRQLLMDWEAFQKTLTNYSTICDIEMRLIEEEYKLVVDKFVIPLGLFLGFLVTCIPFLFISFDTASLIAIIPFTVGWLAIYKTLTFFLENISSKEKNELPGDLLRYYSLLNRLNVISFKYEFKHNNKRKQWKQMLGRKKMLRSLFRDLSELMNMNVDAEVLKTMQIIKKRMDTLGKECSTSLQKEFNKRGV